jgi:hypothetical protein
LNGKKRDKGIAEFGHSEAEKQQGTTLRELASDAGLAGVPFARRSTASGEEAGDLNAC